MQIHRLTSIAIQGISFSLKEQSPKKSAGMKNIAFIHFSFKPKYLTENKTNATKIKMTGADCAGRNNMASWETESGILIPKIDILEG